MLRTTLIGAACALGLLASHGAAAAQEASLRTQCEPASRQEVRTFCENVADGAMAVQPRVFIALAGGNPVPGTASTLGMRIGTLPRFSAGIRVTAAEVALPPVERLVRTSDVEFPLGSIDFDVSVGLFSGINLLPTVGGFGSVDLLGSVGVMPLPRGEGFDDSSPVSWALGARVGILRESFTAPGVSLSAVYRRIGDVAYGDTTLTDRDAWFRMSDQSGYSVRAVAGKRFLGVGLSAGAGWDRVSADFAGAVRDPVVLDPARTLSLQDPGSSQDRVSFFGNASFTLLILNVAAEAGWQQGGETFDGGSSVPGEHGIFGSLALRLAI